MPNISTKEWYVMEVLWANPNSTAAEVSKALLTAETAWHPKTVKTYLGRLVTKRALEVRKGTRAYCYRPAVSKVECVDIACDNFLRRVFDGSFLAMVRFFVENRKISALQLRALRRLLSGNVVNTQSRLGTRSSKRSVWDQAPEHAR